jgi:hypothetical protein
MEFQHNEFTVTDFLVEPTPCPFEDKGPALTDSDGCNELLRLFQIHFVSADQRIAVQAPWGHPCPVEPESVEALLMAHLFGSKAEEATAWWTDKEGNQKQIKGHFRVGVYSTDRRSHCKWLCFDCDGKGHSHALKDPLGVALEIVERLRAVGIPSYLETSQSGNGWHVWVFFSEPVPAKIARHLGLMIAPRNAELEAGGFAMPSQNKAIEIFPKQEELKGNELGNFVWLPFYYGGKNGGNRFYTIE